MQDLSNSVMNGYLRMCDPIQKVKGSRPDQVSASSSSCLLGPGSWCHCSVRVIVLSVSVCQVWKPHFFVLTSHKLFFTTEVEDAEMNKGEDEEDPTENGVRCARHHAY